jgi:acetyltransferase-like isoleucine patch superfamily enzyme
MADGKTWLEHVRANEPFEMIDWDFLAAVSAVQPKLTAFNAITDVMRSRALLADIFRAVGRDAVVLPGLWVDVGINIEIGDSSFINANCTLLDTYPIRIGSNVQIGPHCGIYPVGHPLKASERRFVNAAGETRGMTTGAAITIEDDVWLGGHVVVLPGVTIGARSTIGAGSVVTKSIPPDVFAAGNPCRVIRDLS